MRTPVGSQTSTVIPTAPSTDAASSSTSTSDAPSTSSLDTPAVAPPRDFAQEARQIARNFERAQRAGLDYQPFEPPTTTITNAEGVEIEVPVDPQDAARNAVREFERQQRLLEIRAPEISSPSERLLSAERQNVDILTAERSAANVLSSLASTLAVAQSNAANFYNDFRASNGVNTTGSRFTFNRFA